MEKETYKEQNGTSRVGDWLRTIGRSDILEKAINMAGDIATGDYLGAIKTLIKKDTDISPEQEKEGNRLIELDYKDRARASDMYKIEHKTADEIAKKVIRWNILIAFLSTIVLIACVIYIDDKVLIAIISASLSSLSTSLMQERQQVINFFFGSSIGSKEKTNLLKGK